MGKNDVRISVWLSEKERFADLYNAALFHGKPVFTADTLEKMDTRQNLSFQSNNGREVSVQRFHDICMKSTLGTKLVLLTCENQDAIHYAMPVRSMLYDALDYTDQIRQISQGNKKKKNYHNSAELLSGFTKNDKLVPVIPLVFYYGDEEWDGSLDIHSLLDLSNKEKDTFGKYLPNYKINLVDAKKLAKESCLNSDLQYVLGMLEYKKEKEKLLLYMNGHKEYFEHMDMESYLVARMLLGSEKQLKEYQKKGEIDMCKALDDLYQDGVEKGENRYSQLILKLSELGLTELLVKAASDSDYRDSLYMKYNIK